MNSKVIETTVYYIALITVVCVPPAIFLWFLIHPFAFFWRRLGAAATYMVVIPILVAMGAVLYYFCGPLLSIHFEPRLSLVVIAVFFLAIGIYLGILRMRHLTISMLIGIPEISKEDQPGKLLTEGIYGHVRNPRYIEIGFGLAGIALIVNYLTVYILFILYIPLIYLVVILEEHELRKRFGAAYENYCKEVPRFVPRLRRRL